MGFDFCLHSNIPRADYSDPDHLRHLESKIPHQGFCLVLFINHIFRSRYPASKLSYLGKRNESRENARASGEAARGPSLARSCEACFARPNRRACSQAFNTRPIRHFSPVNSQATMSLFFNFQSISPCHP